ncbi:MAG: hypothetical protein PHR35_23275 [Kiritimatiellae bacterium]|nr:hypothetical protein [Kiritimatiellia bacterium]
MKRMHCRWGLSLALAGLMAWWARAANEWKPTAGIGDWFDDGNWSQLHYPTNGEDVLIANAGAGVLLSNSTAALGSLTISNSATLVFTNWTTALNATTVTIGPGGTMTCAGPFTNNVMSNRVNLVCYSRLTIDTGGAIDVNGKGYAGGTNVTENFQFASGPGAAGWGAASHGGAGRAYAYGPPGALLSSLVYGSSAAPLFPGSGGQAGYRLGNWGGHGGGAVCITAVQVVVNGRISADSSPCSGLYSAGGSGGSIYITCSTIAGTNGTVTANGGSGSGSGSSSGFNGGGGGGRIAVLYDQALQANRPVPSIRFAAESGLGNGTPVMADPGTLYFPDNYFLSPTNIFTGQWLVPGFASWSVPDLVVSSAWIRFPGAGFQLTVTNRLTVTSTDYTSGYLRYRLDLADAAAVRCGQCLLNGGTLTMNCPLDVVDGKEVIKNDDAVITGVAMDCPGDLTLTNAGRLYVGAGLAGAAAPGYGAWVSVGGDVLVASNSWIRPAAHPTNGAAVLFSMRNLAIHRGGGINADYLGYGHHYGWGLPPDTHPTYHYSSGAGYGGRGAPGWRTQAIWGPSYGSSNAPVDPGSGGRGSQDAPTTVGPWGGGSVQIRAVNKVEMHGTITANGDTGRTPYGGGGSGGGLYITCHAFTGDSGGVLRANGGNAGSFHSLDVGGGGGGGGRIAVWRAQDRSPSVIPTYVAGGTSGATNLPGCGTGETGTVVWGWLPGFRTTITIR